MRQYSIFIYNCFYCILLRKYHMKFYILSILLLLSFITNSQAAALDKKGKWYFYYGWNRATYTTSNYHLTGKGYDFTLRNVRAKDTQSELGLDPYLHPTNWSIPQTNIRMGYYLTDTLSVSFGNDHMKYVMERDQTVRFEGTINTGGAYDRSGNGTQKLTADFLLFEHTDGLNYFSVELEKYLPLWSNQTADNAISLFAGPGLAIMYPKTNATLFENSRNDRFNVAGYGFSFKAGVEFIFYERFFARLVAKYGEIRMNDVKTTSNSSDKLSQEFNFSEGFIVFGGLF